MTKKISSGNDNNGKKGYESGTYPKTAEQWWNFVEIHWNDLQTILMTTLKIPEFSLALTAKDNKNPEFVKFLNTSFERTPEEKISSIKGWSYLGDLLDDASVLHYEECYDVSI